jgi:hypothetical protein
VRSVEYQTKTAGILYMCCKRCQGSTVIMGVVHIRQISLLPAASSQGSDTVTQRHHGHTPMLGMTGIPRRVNASRIQPATMRFRS